jgi:hypothetical protein
LPPSYGFAKDDSELKAAVQRKRDALEPRIGLPRPRVRPEHVLVGEDVVGDDESACLQLRARKLEQALVIVLLGVEEADVEDVVDSAQRRESVPLDELGRYGEPGLGDVLPPGGRLGRVGLEREYAPSQQAGPRG